MSTRKKTRRRAPIGRRSSVNDEVRATLFGSAGGTHQNRAFSRVPPGFYSRNMLLSALRISRYELDFLEQSGVIKPSMVNEHGWRLYSHTLVDEILSKRKSAQQQLGAPRLGAVSSTFSDDQAQRVFKMLKDNARLEDIVIETGIHPSVVRSAAAEYSAFTGMIIVSKEGLDEIHQLPLEGELPLTDERMIIDLIKHYAVSKCTSCRKRSPLSICLACLREKSAKKQNAATAASSTSPADAPPTGSSEH